MPTILHLTVEKRWFDLIASGEKLVEYREVKPYWISRLMTKEGALRQDFDEVHFRNGYKKDAPFMRVKFSHMTLYAKRFIVPMHGEQIVADQYFFIHLGPVLEIMKPKLNREVTMSSFEWKKTTPEHDGDFYYSGKAPNGEEDILGIVQIVTSPNGERMGYLFIPPGWRGDTERKKAALLLGKLEDWKGEWAGPEFGLCCAVAD